MDWQRIYNPDPNKPLPLYTAEPGPRTKAYSHLLSGRKENLRAAPGVPPQGWIPEYKVKRLWTITHNLMAPELHAGQQVVVVNSHGFESVHLVRYQGEAFCCRLKELQDGQVKIWFSVERSKHNFEEVICSDDPHFEIVGAVIEPRGPFHRVQYFWPAEQGSSN